MGSGRSIVPAMSRTQNRKTPLAAYLIRKVAVESPADPRSVVKVLRGEPVSPMTRDRILRALEARGLGHLISQPSATAGSEK